MAFSPGCATGEPPSGVIGHTVKSLALSSLAQTTTMVMRAATTAMPDDDFLHLMEKLKPHDSKPAKTAWLRVAKSVREYDGQSRASVLSVRMRLNRLLRALANPVLVSERTPLRQRVAAYCRSTVNKTYPMHALLSFMAASPTPLPTTGRALRSRVVHEKPAVEGQVAARRSRSVQEKPVVKSKVPVQPTTRSERVERPTPVPVTESQTTTIQPTIAPARMVDVTMEWDRRRHEEFMAMQEETKVMRELLNCVLKQSRRDM